MANGIAGRPKSEETIAAERMGVSRRTFIRLGGIGRIPIMSEDALAVMLKPQRTIMPYDRTKTKASSHIGMMGRKFLRIPELIEPDIRFIERKSVDPGKIAVLDCPICGALKGEMCINLSGHPRVDHKDRARAWERKYDQISRVTPEGGRFNLNRLADSIREEA